MRRLNNYKNVLFVVLIVVAVMMVSFCGGSGTSDSKNDKKSYPEQLDHALNKSKTIANDQRMRSLISALNSYYSDNNQYPDQMEDLVPNYTTSPSDLIDVWGAPFKLQENENMQWELISAGRDQVYGNDDDIKRSL